MLNIIIYTYKSNLIFNTMIFTNIVKSYWTNIISNIILLILLS